MAGFDWNKNGKKDNFDRFMDMKVMSSVSDEVESDDLDLDDDIDAIDEEEMDDDINIDVEKVELQNVSITTSKASQPNSFQEELKKNMKTPEMAKKEREDLDNSLAMFEAEDMLKRLKQCFIGQVKRAEYTKQNGVTSVTCTIPLDRHYYISYPSSTQHMMEVFEIHPQMKDKYYRFITSLKQIAKKDKIDIDVVILIEGNVVSTFPSTVKAMRFARPCIKATTIIDVDPNYKPSTTEKSIPINNTDPFQKEFKGFSIGGKPLYDASKDSNGTAIFKCLLVTALCIGGIALPVATEMGPLGTLICIFSGIVLSIIILKNV